MSRLNLSCGGDGEKIGVVLANILRTTQAYWQINQPKPSKVKMIPDGDG